jgi:signal transduction histidine kinase
VDIRQALGKRSLLGIGLTLAAITAFHYITSPVAIVQHNVYRRLYYLPIVWAAFAGGLRYGIAVAAMATIAYLPHAFFLHGHMDPAPDVDKALEIILYFGVGGLAGILVDRERRARSRQQRETLARAAAESRADRLAGLVHLSRGLAHEIRNPLGGIQGAIEILAEEVDHQSPRREMVNVGLRETARLSNVLSEFLQFARPREPVMKPFSMQEVVLHVVELQRSLADEGGIELSINKGRDIPLVHGDREQITQVLLNLVRNALQATPTGGSVEVRTKTSQSGSNGERRLVLEVADTGKGIPTELGDSIYDPYVTDRVGGTGLGLAISTLLVQQHGGALTHEMQQGRGAVFRFDLPVATKKQSVA